MFVYKFFIHRDYNQFSDRVIAESSFNLKIMDYQFQNNERVKIKIKEENDSDSNIAEFYLRKGTDNQFIVDFPFNKRGTFEFTLQIENRNGEILEKSAINTFKYEGSIYNESLITGSAEWGIIQDLLRRLDEPKQFVQKELETLVNNSDFASIANEFVENKEEELNDFIEEKKEEISQFVEEKGEKIDNHLKIIDGYLDEAQDKIDTLLSDINSLLDIFIKEGEE